MQPTPQRPELAKTRAHKSKLAKFRALNKPRAREDHRWVRASMLQRLTVEVSRIRGKIQRTKIRDRSNQSP